MEVILKADKYLNGNHHLLNIIFSYLGQSPSAKVMSELTNDEDLNEVIESGLFGNPFPRTYFQMRLYAWGYCGMRMKKYTPLSIPRFKVEVCAIDDGNLCERCTNLLNFTERENYGGYCERCYAKVHHIGQYRDYEPEPEPEWEDETDEDEEDI
jgi:hypothetical protein